ncbi:pyridoxamine 5'-phosphate oxidase family protein [Actinacidiphila glaucinigra]|uniref:pyridoxamine 5'-phosphate oxidase family protein n=1 Tax=Actinacidiphila glaucinigra TaxID=235986 RepID=UPI0037CA0796
MTRTLRERHTGAMVRLRDDEDVWVATADGEGAPCLVPLSFWWDGQELWLATRRTNPTGRNLEASGRVRLSLGHTRDLVLVDGTARVVEFARLPDGVGDAFAAKAAWDPRGDGPSYAFYAVRPQWVQAWGTATEMRDRDLMKEGVWLF